MHDPAPDSPLALLEARQDDVLRQLDELDRRIELTIKQFTKSSLRILPESTAGSPELN